MKRAVRGAVNALNYHHLLYFWTVAREGTVTRAAEVLGLRQPTVSEQLKTFEDTLGEQLFERRGRGLVLTDVGRVVFGYAESIFELGRELQDTLAGRAEKRPAKLQVGVSDVLPKLVLRRLLAPALRMDPPVQIVCREDKTDKLLAELALSDLDLVLADALSHRAFDDSAAIRANSILETLGLTEISVSFSDVFTPGL